MSDNPVRKRRLAAGASQSELATLAKVSRDTVAQVESGRIKTLNPQIATVLAGWGRTSAEAVEHEFAQWQKSRRDLAHLPQRGRNVLALPPEVVARYESFGQWRRDVLPSLYAFAQWTGVNYTTIRRFEEGKTPMPRTLMRALMVDLGVSSEYVDELRRLGEKGAS